MNVKQLKEQLNKYPDDMDVLIAERETEFSYEFLKSLYIIYIDDPESEPLCSNTVLVLDNE